MTYIHIDNIISKEQADKFSKAVHGKSYMNFQVIVAPIGGTFAVGVQTDYTDYQNEANEMLIGLMFDAISQ